jgi:uncharacterized protein (TIGR00297 family)
LLQLPALTADLIMKAVVLIALGVVSLLLKAVSLSGFVAGMALGVLVLAYGDWNAFLLVAFFHIVAAAFTRFKYEKKRRMGVAQEKGGAREWGNVVANGAWASIAATCEGLLGGKGFVGAYLASVSTGLADTLATEIGLLSKREPRLITDPRKVVERGASGGVTLLGTSVALLASLTIGVLSVIGTDWLGLSGILRAVPTSTKLIVSTIGGFSGAMVDSVMGATIQGMYVCDSCGKMTEKKTHCGNPAKKIRGYEVIDNNAVNFASIFVSCVIGFVLASWL